MCMPLTSNGESSHAPVNNGHKRKAFHFLTCRRIQMDNRQILIPFLSGTSRNHNFKFYQ